MRTHFNRANKQTSKLTFKTHSLNRNKEPSKDRMASYTAVVGVSPEGRGVVGWVIGKGGSGIKAIIESTGVRGINYENGKSQFVVTGAPSRVEAASKILRQKIQECMIGRRSSARRKRDNIQRKRDRSTYKSDMVVPDAKRRDTTKRGKTGFDALTEMEDMTYQEYLTKQQKEKDEREAARAAEEKELEDAWTGMAKVSLEDTRAKSAEQEAKAKADLAERTKVPDGMVVHRREEPEV